MFGHRIFVVERCNGRSKKSLLCALSVWFAFAAALAGWLSACSSPDLRPETLKLVASRQFPAAPDTSYLGVARFSEGTDKVWWMVYNRYADSPQVVFYRAPRYEVSHRIRFDRLPPCEISGLRIIDPQNDGNWLLWLDLTFDHGTVYQKREAHIFRSPFESDDWQKVLETVTYEAWSNIESFDSLDNPLIRRRIGFDAALDAAPEGFCLTGTIDGLKNERLCFGWDDGREQFLPIAKEHLVRFSPSDTVGRAPNKTGLQIKKMDAWRVQCNTWSVLDRTGQPVALPDFLSKALECSDIASISPDGRFLVYEDSSRKNLCLYDFEKKRKKVLFSYPPSQTGISDILWSPTGKRFGTVLVDPSEYPEETSVLLFSLKPDGHFSPLLKPARVPFSCDAGRCFARPEEDYRFESESSFRFRNEKNGGFERIVF